MAKNNAVNATTIGAEGRRGLSDFGRRKSDTSKVLGSRPNSRPIDRNTSTRPEVAAAFPGVDGDLTRSLRRGRLEPHELAEQLGAADAIDDPVDVLLWHLEQREPLEHAHVPDVLAVEPGRGGDRVDDVRGLETGGPPQRDDHLAGLAVAVGGVVRLGVPARLGLHRGRCDVRVLDPWRERDAGVVLQRAELSPLLRPTRPVRPIRWTYTSGEVGTS